MPPGLISLLIPETQKFEWNFKFCFYSKSSNFLFPETNWGFGPPRPLCHVLWLYQHQQHVWRDVSTGVPLPHDVWPSTGNVSGLYTGQLWYTRGTAGTMYVGAVTRLKFIKFIALGIRCWEHWVIPWSDFKVHIIQMIIISSYNNMELKWQYILVYNLTC